VVVVMMMVVVVTSMALPRFGSAAGLARVGGSDGGEGGKANDDEEDFIHTCTNPAVLRRSRVNYKILSFLPSALFSGPRRGRLPPLMRFANQVAIVTGAGRGIGHAIALRLASEGCRVAVVSRTEGNAIRTADEINAQYAGLSTAYAVDVASYSAVKKIVEQILADFSRIDILVNNAGLTRDNLSIRLSEEDWDVVVDTNLKGAFNCIQAVSRTMIRQRSGKIINISSVAGLVGNAGQANYAASKAGLLGLTKTIARELASRSITCNAVAPGFITTDMTEALPEQVKTGVIRQVPMGKFGEPNDVAAAVAFLASNEAKYITGQCLTVDGGMVM
jgi:3-oxoacyl-[acyl-carrier protein] reductase